MTMAQLREAQSSARRPAEVFPDDWKDAEEDGDQRCLFLSPLGSCLD
jgi:hypothetical protein